MLTFFFIMSGEIRIGEKSGIIVDDGSEVDVFDRYWPNIPSPIYLPETSSPPPYNRNDGYLTVSHGKGEYGINLKYVDDSQPALLVFSTRGVDYTKNFVTWMPDENLYSGGWLIHRPRLNTYTYEGARDFPGFAGLIKQGIDETSQVFEISPGVLRNGSTNRLGIHARDVDGKWGQAAGDRDNFMIRNILLMYHQVPHFPIPTHSTVPYVPGPKLER